MASPDETAEALRIVWRSGRRPHYDPKVNTLMHEQQMDAWHRACRHVPVDELYEAAHTWCSEPDTGWPQPAELLSRLPRLRPEPVPRATGHWQRAYCRASETQRVHLLKMLDEACASVRVCDSCRGRRSDCPRCSNHILALADQAVRQLETDHGPRAEDPAA